MNRNDSDDKISFLVQRLSCMASMQLCSHITKKLSHMLLIGMRSVIGGALGITLLTFCGAVEITVSGPVVIGVFSFVTCRVVRLLREIELNILDRGAFGGYVVMILFVQFQIKTF